MLRYWGYPGIVPCITVWNDSEILGISLDGPLEMSLESRNTCGGVLNIPRYTVCGIPEYFISHDIGDILLQDQLDPMIHNILGYLRYLTYV